VTTFCVILLLSFVIAAMLVVVAKLRWWTVIPVTIAVTVIAYILVWVLKMFLLALPSLIMVAIVLFAGALYIRSKKRGEQEARPRNPGGG